MTGGFGQPPLASKDVDPADALSASNFATAPHLTKAQGAQNLVESFGFALAGMRVLLAERNFRIHVLIAAGVMLAAAVLRVSRVDWLVLLLAIALMLATESLNTALEAAVDLICGPRVHPIARRAKDAAAAACLLVAAICVVIGVVVFAPYLQALFF